jgi:uncharacterized UBP type Zn finger protein
MYAWQPGGGSRAPRDRLEGMAQVNDVAQMCPHSPEVVASPSGARCEECGSTWNLRLCASCGHVGCCESQAGHARAHALGLDHPVIYQLPVGSDSFVWCYAENRYL